MAKLYILTEEHIKNGQRPKTPRQKQKDWAKVCLALGVLIILEHITLLCYWIK